jgi:non-specific serine/threonine protein kinase
LARTVGDPFHLALVLISCGAAQNYSGNYEEGHQLLQEALDCATSVADLTLRAAIQTRALANLSVSARGLGSLGEAVSMAERALLLCEQHDFELAAARTLMDLADIAKDQGDFARAVPLYREGIERHGERGELRLLADGFAGIASAATLWGHSRSALLLFGAAAAIRERIGYDMLLQLDVSIVDRDLRQLRATVGDREVTATLQEGRALTLGEAVAIVTAITPQAARPSSAALVMQEELTPREHDVLRLLLQGHTDREIAEALYLSPRTVSWHVRAILAKLGANSRREAVQRLRDHPRP